MLGWVGWILITLLFARISYGIGKEVGEVEGNDYPKEEGAARHWTEIESLKSRDKKEIFWKRFGGIFWWCASTSLIVLFAWHVLDSTARDPNTWAYFYSNR